MPLDHSDARPATPALCWLHGFTQTGRSAHLFRSILAAHRTLRTPDLPGHGTSRDVRATLDETADLIVDSWDDEIVDLGGYSLGARVALHIALRHAHRVRRLVLIGATRGLVDAAAREQRRSRDEALAERIITLGAPVFIDEWLRQPMFADLPVDSLERATREGHSASGLANSLRDAGTGTQRWLGDELASLPLRTLAVAGVQDVRFAREARAIASSVPSANVQLVPGSGHAAHLHQPTWSARIIEEFLDESASELAGSDQGDAQE